MSPLISHDHLTRRGPAGQMVSAAMRNQPQKSWLSAEQSLLGGMALAALAAACIWLVLGPAPDIADHLIAIALLVETRSV